jgi:flagellar basal-body rod modification protein FlgD
MTGATTARIDVLDGTGRVLRGSEVTLTGASQDWRWDGRDSGGRLLADGAYSVRVTAAVGAGATGSTLGPALPFTVVGRATGAERVEGEVRLKLGTLAVNFDRLRGVVE